jgi:hypothetical protein
MVVCCQLVDLEVAPPRHELFRLFRVFRGRAKLVTLFQKDSGTEKARAILQE